MDRILHEWVLGGLGGFRGCFVLFSEEGSYRGWGDELVCSPFFLSHPLHDCLNWNRSGRSKVVG